MNKKKLTSIARGYYDQIDVDQEETKVRLHDVWRKRDKEEN